jgi:hypothetical protein
VVVVMWFLYFLSYIHAPLQKSITKRCNVTKCNNSCHELHMSNSPLFLKRKRLFEKLFSYACVSPIAHYSSLEQNKTVEELKSGTTTTLFVNI